MTRQKRLQMCVDKFTENQKNAIAEMIACDCLLTEIWHEQVIRFIKDNEWKPNMLLRSLIDRIEEVVRDIEQTEILTGFDNKE